jgi:uncharacterized membrane protein
MPKKEYEMMVVAFNSEDEAERVLDTLKRLDRKDIVDLKSAAVIVRSSSDKVKIKETRDFDAKQGAIGGALAGGVLGLLKGGLLKKALLGAAGGALAGKVVDLGVEDDFLKEVGQGLGPGSSAIVALVDFERIDAAMEELDKFEGGRILRHRLSGDVYRKLSDAVAD